MASAAERFFALPELPLTNIEQQHHIFAAAFYRDVRYHVLRGRCLKEAHMS